MLRHEIKVYKRLTRVLHKIPNGFPSTKDGTHLKVLQWLFTPEEAKIACKLKLIAETSEKIAKRINIPKEKLDEKLEIMHEKGLILRKRREEGIKYSLLPFVVGIYEDQLNRMDKEFSLLMEDYMKKTGLRTIMTAKPSIFRVVPVQRTINTELMIHTYQNAEQIIKNAKSWGMRACVCKKEKGLIGEPCKIGDSGCLTFSKRENAFDNVHRTIAITKEKALQILKDAEEKGLVHCTMNIQTGHEYICNCCTCCCGVLRAYKEFGAVSAFVKSDYLMKVDEQKCIGCATCINRCQFEALTLQDGVMTVNKNCIGCGVCAVVCPEDALQLVDRNPKELSKPPKSDRSWYIKRMVARLTIPWRLIK